MQLLLLLLTLFATPALATSQMCEELDYELQQAVKSKLITQKDRTDIYRRCLRSTQ